MSQMPERHLSVFIQHVLGKRQLCLPLQ